MCIGKYSNEGALLADWYYSLAWRFISFEIPTNVLFQSYFVYCYLAGGISSVQLAGRLLGSHPWVHAGFPGRLHRLPHSTSIHSGKNQPYYAHLKERKVVIHPKVQVLMSSSMAQIIRQINKTIVLLLSWCKLIVTIEKENQHNFKSVWVADHVYFSFPLIIFSVL